MPRSLPQPEFEHRPDDESLDDIGRELCASDREASCGFDPGSNREAFRVAIERSRRGRPSR